MNAYSTLAHSLVRRAIALSRADYITIEKDEALSALELAILDCAQTYDEKRGASFETYVLSTFKYQIRAAYGSPGGHPVFSFDETLKDEFGDALPHGYLEFEAIRAAEQRHDQLAEDIKQPLPADKREQLNALPGDLRRVAFSLIENDFDREAAAAALGVGERTIRRECNKIVELMQRAGGLPAQPDLF